MSLNCIQDGRKKLNEALETTPYTSLLLLPSYNVAVQRYRHRGTGIPCTYVVATLYRISGSRPRFRRYNPIRTCVNIENQRGPEQDGRKGEEKRGNRAKPREREIPLRIKRRRNEIYDFSHSGPRRSGGWLSFVTPSRQPRNRVQDDRHIDADRNSSGGGGTQSSADCRRRRDYRSAAAT